MLLYVYFRMTSYRHITPLFRSLSKNNNKFSRYYSNVKLDPHGKTVFQILKGRDLLTFNGYTQNDIYSLLWVAKELKTMKGQSLTETAGKRICLIWSNPVAKASVTHACQKLNASICSFYEGQLSNSKEHLGRMLGRLLGTTSDVIFVDAPSWSQAAVNALATGCTCPVIVISSQELSPAIAYSEMFTLFEKYGFLRRLIISYVGPGNNIMLNTYFTVLPIIGMNLRYLTIGELPNQRLWEKGMSLSIKNNTEMKQFEDVANTVYRSHCISTCGGANQLNLKMSVTKEMDLDWSLLQHDASKGLAVSQDFLRAFDHNLIFKEIENQSWIFQALILTHTCDYIPSMPAPRFEGVN